MRISDWSSDVCSSDLVQCRGGFVADKETGARGQRAGDADALALAAGKLMGKTAQRLMAQADIIEQIAHYGAGLLFVFRQFVKADGLGHDIQNAHARIERRERVLEHHLDLAPECRSEEHTSE